MTWAQVQATTSAVVVKMTWHTLPSPQQWWFVGMTLACQSSWSSEWLFFKSSRTLRSMLANMDCVGMTCCYSTPCPRSLYLLSPSLSITWLCVLGPPAFQRLTLKSWEQLLLARGMRQRPGSRYRRWEWSRAMSYMLTQWYFAHRLVIHFFKLL